MTNRLLGVSSHWLPLGGAIVILCAFAYAAIQQSYRTALNDPQIQMVEDAQAALLAALVISFILDFLGDAWRRRAMEKI